MKKVFSIIGIFVFLFFFASQEKVFGQACPPGANNPYYYCSNGQCVIAAFTCGSNGCNSNADCPAVPPQPECPAGQKRPFTACSNNTCQSINGCGVDSCSSSSQCTTAVTQPPAGGCPTGTSTCGSSLCCGADQFCNSGVSCQNNAPPAGGPDANGCYACSQCSGNTCTTYSSSSPCATSCNTCSGGGGGGFIPPTPTYSISGNVFIDTNNNRVKNGSEQNYTGGITITARSGLFNTFTVTYPSSGSFSAANLNAGTYTITYTNPPSGYTVTTPNANIFGQYSFSITVGASCGGGGGTCASGSISGVNFGLSNATRTIAGSVFVDTNEDQLKNTGEGNYSGGITVTSTGGATAIYPSSGNFLISNLAPGTYTITYTNAPPAGHKITYPVGGVGNPSFSVTIGTNQGTCSVGGSNSASCNGTGSISNLNFGVNPISDPWIQSTGGNIRIDSGINNPIPANANPVCGGPNMSLPGNGGQPGIVYSGNNSSSFGSGQASAAPYNWVVSTPDGQNYSPPTPNTIRTSYAYLLSNANKQGLTTSDLASQCAGGLSNCTLPANLPSAFYLANGDLTLTGNYTFPSNKNFIILVHGNLTLRGQIKVPAGSSAVFSASGNITVDRAVGQASITSSTTDLEGIFSADQNFIVAGTNDCNVAPDLRLNIAGNVIANAALTGGSFTNQRDLCTGNTCPSISIAQRLDMIINLPPLLKAPNRIWREVAP